MDIESIEAFLKEKKEREETRTFEGDGYIFEVDREGLIEVTDMIKTERVMHFGSSMPVLFDAVELAKERYKG